MASPINKKVIKHLAGLARIELSEREENKLLKDIREILNYFKELEQLDTTVIEPIAGSTHLRNVFREDGERQDSQKRKGREDFPKSENGYLHVPSVLKYE